nr:RNA-directed DNA polymerase, eukaryota, reverse transcriptase zinc-binding domain protein [Tanacetum cinerariifolium]
SNMYHVCQAEGFVDVKIHYLDGLWVWLQFSSVNSCEAFKSFGPSLRFLHLPLLLMNKLFRLRLAVFLYTNEDVDPNAALADFIQQNIVKESALKDSKEGDQANVSTHVAGDNENLFSGKVKEEYFVKKEDKPSKEDVPDTSKPPGFENFIKKNSESSISSNASRSGKCSTSFGNYKRKELKGFSFIDEMSRMIEVGGTLGYDVKGCKKSLRKMINRIVRSDSERFGSIFSSEDAAIFNDFIQESGLIDLPMGVVALDRRWSDHNPILLHLKKFDFGLTPFIIFHSWFDRIDFQKVVKDKWDDITREVLGYTKSLHTKLKDLKSHLKIWYSHTKEVKTSRMNLLLADMRNLDQKIDEGLASDEDKSSRISTNKAPGPDGYSFLFIKRFWDLLKHDIQEFVVSFFSSGKFLQDVNSAFITLIPKVSNPLFIKDYRPISLIGLHYKIVAKILSNRLSKVIDSIISPEQSAFISGRQILDGPLILNEIIDWYKKLKKKLMLFKVDFEKAFDYLGLLLSSMGVLLRNFLSSEILIDRFKARLLGWKANLLSIGGRLTLIKSVLGSL